MFLSRSLGFLTALIWLGVAGYAQAADICNAVALVDVPNSPESIQYGSNPIAFKKGEIVEAVTQYSVDRKSGVGSFCSHGGGCYPRYITIGNRRVEALRLVNCKIGGEVIGSGDEEEAIYSIDVDPSKNDPGVLRYDAADDALIEIGMSSAGASNAADKYIKEPQSQCGRVVARALGGDADAKAELQTEPQYCLSYAKTQEKITTPPTNAASTASPSPSTLVGSDHPIRNALVALIVFVSALYFLPTIVAALRKKRNLPAIAVLNIFLGWTFIGWVAALVWSVMRDDPPPTV